jgi:hypothetical protein
MLHLAKPLQASAATQLINNVPMLSPAAWNCDHLLETGKGGLLEVQRPCTSGLQTADTVQIGGSNVPLMLCGCIKTMRQASKSLPHFEGPVTPSAS